MRMQQQTAERRLLIEAEQILTDGGAMCDEEMYLLGIFVLQNTFCQLFDIFRDFCVY